MYMLECGKMVNGRRSIMEFQKVVETRRSVRAFNPLEKVSGKQMREILEAAILAPSWKNSQTARYYCVVSSDLLEKVRRECLPEFNANSCQGASVLVVTAFVMNRSGFERDGRAVNELGNGWGIYDLALQNENMVLKAKDLGIDSLIMGIRDEARLREMLEVPKDQKIVSVIAFGYGMVELEMPPRKKDTEIARFF